jgi:hypothetical protein
MGSVSGLPREVSERSHSRPQGGWLAAAHQAGHVDDFRGHEITRNAKAATILCRCKLGLAQFETGGVQRAQYPIG